MKIKSLRIKLNNIFKHCGGDGRKPSEKIYYEAMTPSSKIDNGDEYFKALDWALKQDSVKNIAITGPYGSGKSSVIESYLKKNVEISPLRISMAAFDLENKTQGTSCKLTEKQLQTGILKQLFYSVSADDIPDSRYRKLIPEKGWKIAIYSICSEILLAILLYFLSPNNVKKLIVGLSTIISVPEWLICIAVASVSMPIMIKIVKWFYKHKNVQEFSVGNLASMKANNDNSESIFNKNLEEIIYLFERTKHSVMVIEDLDRFESTEIFVALRELNNILNNYDKINNKITFIYAVRDDMFKKAEERTKFFDFILPVVPYISDTNSEEIFKQKLLIDNNTNRSTEYDIEGRYVSLVSPYICDMRVLVCVCNEFNIFKNTLKNGQGIDLRDDMILSLIILKNLYPVEFSKIENGSEDSLMKKVFDSKSEFIENRSELLEKESEEESNKLKEIEKETLKSVMELKVCFLSQLMDNKGIVYTIKCKGITYDYSKLLADELDIKSLDGNVTFYCEQNGNSYIKEENNIKEIFNERGADYIERIERAKKGLDICKQESKVRIEEYENKINELRSWKVKQIIDEFGIDFLDESVRNNDLLVFMLRNGLIDETFENYINYFHLQSISREEINFILGIRNHRWTEEYTYKLEHVERIFERLQDYEFEQKEVLNFNLVDYVLNKKIESKHARFLFEQLSNQSKESMSFVKAFFTRGEYIQEFINQICRKNKLFWINISNDDGISLETEYKYLNAIFKYADVKDIIALNDYKQEKEHGDLYQFIVSNPTFLKNINEVQDSKVIEIIDKLEVKFTDVEIDGIEDSIIKHIFDKCRYELNPTMIHKFVEWKSPHLLQKLEKKCYTTIFELNYKPLLDYVHSNFENYINNNVLYSKTNTEEQVGAVNDILERLIDNSEICILVLDKEHVNWENLNDCCAGLKDEEGNKKQYIWNNILENNRMICKWDNFVAYYDTFGISAQLVDYFERNVDELLKNTNNTCIPYSVLEELMLSEITIDCFKKLVISGIIKSYTDSLDKLNEEKIKVMIEDSKLPYTQKYWAELKSVAPKLRVIYAEKYQTDFAASLPNIEISEDEIGIFLNSEIITDEKKQKILSKLPAESMTIDLAEIIKGLTFAIDRKYADAAWKILPDEDKYELFLNQIDQYQDTELPDMFNKLADVYHTFSDRRRHKYTIDYTKYNKKLSDKLFAREYLSSAYEIWGDDGRHAITGNVKQAK